MSAMLLSLFFRKLSWPSEGLCRGLIKYPKLTGLNNSRIIFIFNFNFLLELVFGAVDQKSAIELPYLFYRIKFTFIPKFYLRPT